MEPVSVLSSPLSRIVLHMCTSVSPSNHHVAKSPLPYKTVNSKTPCSQVIFLVAETAGIIGDVKREAGFKLSVFELMRNK